MKPLAILLFALSFASNAADLTPKYNAPQYPGAGKTCPAGQAQTYLMQCDAGSRAPVDEAWGQRTPGVSLCRVTLRGCSLIERRATDERPGFEVRDATASGELVSVTFGLERLLGEVPF